MLPSPIIYLDYNATTPVAPEVMNEMLPFYLSNYGNASSNDHLLGWQAKEAVAEARLALAEILGCTAHEVIFTAGATESINMVLRGLKIMGKNHIITCKTEHNAVLDTCQELEHEGYTVTYLEVDSDGLVDLEQVKAAINEETLLVAIMWVNNETGVIQPIEAIGQICQEREIPFMSDATQAIGKLRIDLASLPVDIILGSAHKIYGPKGIGFLATKQRWLSHLEPVITGGGQESRKRAGTTNVPGIVGLTKAVSLAYERLGEDTVHINQLRDQFEQTLVSKFKVEINGSENDRLYNTSNLCFSGHDSERIMQAIGSKVAASRGSACSSEKISPSHVLAAMGLSDDEAHASIRFSIGRYTTKDEVNEAARYIISALGSLSRS